MSDDVVWIVLRGEGADVEVDVFSNEAAAREHAARLTDTPYAVFEETVAASAWAPVESE